jgi:hypothetical protein
MASSQSAEPKRLTTRWMHVVFFLGSLFVAAAGVQLYVLASDTDRFFAWTIGIPLTAAFLGSYYWTAMVVSVLSWRERNWANARVGVVGVLVFLLLTLATTLINLAQFHLSHGPLTARLAAWAWLIIYVLDPTLVAGALVAQMRARGVDPPRRRRFSAWYRAAIATSALVSVSVGIALFAAPHDAAAALWPWPLTSLTARMVAAWLVGGGIILAAMVHENDHRRTRPAAVAYTALGILQLGALARYSASPDWESTASWLYVIFFASAIGLGLYGTLESRRAIRAVG